MDVEDNFFSMTYLVITSEEFRGGSYQYIFQYYLLFCGEWKRPGSRHLAALGKYRF